METRIEHDTLGEVKVPANCHWGAQTQRSLENFPIGTEKMPQGILTAFAYLKEACAQANAEFGKLTASQAQAIAQGCQEVRSGQWDGEFPLAVWQTGSGTQTNMNVNEVLAHLAGTRGVALHPNDHVNASQSSNDTFPSALHIAAVLALEERVLPAAERLTAEMERLERENRDIIKIGRTHLQDATPLRFSQELSGWRELIAAPMRMLQTTGEELRALAIGGTAVGTGLNAPQGFDAAVCRRLTALTGTAFHPDGNKFHALTSLDALVFAHGALKALAANLMKIANDIRWYASGPRCGLGEVRIPANEPGSSIMPGKVNPTQCEAVTMVAVQVMGNDVAVGLAASQGNFQLNVFLPVCAYNFLQSARLLGDCMDSFRLRCLAGLTADRRQMTENLHRSLMLVTCLTPQLGYEKAAQAAKKALEEGTTLREAVIALGALSGEAFDELVRPEKMVGEENAGIRLRPYESGDAAVIVGWAADEKALRQWTADRFMDEPFPLRAAQFDGYYRRQGATHIPMTAVEGDDVVGHVMLRWPEESRETMRLGFITVAPAHRGRGVGRRMVAAAVEYAFKVLHARRVTLGVFQNNPAAQRCYRAVGFYATGEKTMAIGREIWPCVEMEVTEETFLSDGVSL